MPNPLPRCQIKPLPDSQFTFEIDDREVTRWCFSPLVPRPFFYPVTGPSGESLTRMGHPGAPNHDHHRSFWFAHNDVVGHDFWAENKPPRITQPQWYAIEDGDDYARMGLELHWTDGRDPKPLIKQDLFITVRPLAAKQWTLELQSDFRAGRPDVAFSKSNFGVLGLRVAKSLSVVFGAGTVTGADGAVGEPNLFGKSNRWIDYSGPISRSYSGDLVNEGLTLIDHKSNLHHPTKWHIRNDGWIGPSLSRDIDVSLLPDPCLTVRYLLVVHSGLVDAKRLNELADEFDDRPTVRVQKGSKPHHQWEMV